jgi:tetratricopeptide (TPR) repeat protein
MVTAARSSTLLGMNMPDPGILAECLRQPAGCFDESAIVDRGTADQKRQSAIALQEGRPEESLELAEQGLRSSPGDEELLYAKALALVELERYEAADAVIGELIRTGPARGCFGNVGRIRGLLAPQLLATICLVQHDYGRAELILRRLRSEFSTETNTLYHLGLVYIATEKANELRELVATLRGLPGGRAYGDLLMARWHFRRGETAVAEKLADELVHEMPESACAWIIRAELVACRQATQDEQLRAWYDVLRVQPGNRRAQREITFLENAVCPIVAQCTPIIAQLLGADWSSSINRTGDLALE